MLIDGHLRAETTPDQVVPVLILDVDEDEANKLLATLDPLAAMAETDKLALKDLASLIHTDSEDIRALLEKVGGVIGVGQLQDPPAQIDKAAELQAKWRTARGQAWQIGPHRLVCGDCREKGDVGR